MGTAAGVMHTPQVVSLSLTVCQLRCMLQRTGQCSIARLTAMMSMKPSFDVINLLCPLLCQVLLATAMLKRLNPSQSCPLVCQGSPQGASTSPASLIGTFSNRQADVAWPACWSSHHTACSLVEAAPEYGSRRQRRSVDPGHRTSLPASPSTQPAQQHAASSSATLLLDCSLSGWHMRRDTETEEASGQPSEWHRCRVSR